MRGRGIFFEEDKAGTSLSHRTDEDRLVSLSLAYQCSSRQTGIAITCISVLLVGYLLICDDAESNPGSGNGRGVDCSGKEGKERNDRHDNTAIPSSLSLS